MSEGRHECGLASGAEALSQAGLAGGPVESWDLVGEDEGVLARGKANDGSCLAHQCVSWREHSLAGLLQSLVRDQ